MTTLKERGIEEREMRARARRMRIVAHRASGFQDAENWDLSFWQSKTPQERLSALVDIREDIRKVQEARRNYEQHR